MKTAADTRRILDSLEGQHPDADTELHYQNAFQLLVATILSAQSTDQGVNMVTPALFSRYPDANALATAVLAELEPQIHSTGFFRQKAKALVGMAQALVERHHGEVPADMDALVELPGVGRKTANVVLGHALGVPGLPVDRHVLRVSNRIGIAESDDPVVVEQQLCAALPADRWIRASDTLILHGRRICRPQPRCDVCAVSDVCDYYNSPAARVAPALSNAGGHKRRPKSGKAPGRAAWKVAKKAASKPKKNSPKKKAKRSRGTPRVRRPRR